MMAETPLSEGSVNWTRENMAWCAGLFEGEGCVYPGRRAVNLVIKMGDFDVLESFRQRCGLGHIDSHSYPNGKGAKDFWTPMWVWRVQGKRAYALCMAMWPWLHERRRQRIRESVDHWLAAPALHPDATLTNEQAQEIYLALLEDHSRGRFTRLAEQYDCPNYQTISNIWHGKTYKSATRPWRET